MPRLSVVIITYNEEDQVGRCIDSVQGLADEVLVLDSFSTDRTREICLAKGAVFHEHAFDGYIQQKNRALALAANDFVLSLDADEALSKELYNSIRAVKERPAHPGYSMNRLTNYCGKWIRHCGWYPDTKLRLADRKKASWKGVNPHDRLELEAGEPMHLKGDILHYSYHSISGHIKQANHFTDLMAKEAYERGKRSNLLKIIFKPIIKFIRDYIIKLGFLDGYYGFVISAISSQATFFKYLKIHELQSKRDAVISK